MNRLYSLLAAISLIFIYACENDNEPIKQVYEHKLNFGSIKVNQTDSVIMPLKVGKEWIYKVSTFDKRDSNNNVYVYYDTIRVLSEVSDRNGRWFLVKYLDVESEPVLMTNTDKGLWMKRQFRDESLKLVAEYPLISDFYYAGNLGLIYPYEWDPALSKTENDVPKNCNLFTTTFTFQTAFVKQRTYAGNMYRCDIRSEIGVVLNELFSESYFSPGLGLIKESRRRDQVEYYLVDWK